MLQDISPKHLYNEYRPNTEVADQDYVICLFEDEVLATTSQSMPAVLVDTTMSQSMPATLGNTTHEDLDFPTFGMLKDQLTKGDVTYIFSVDQEKYFLFYKRRVLPEKNTDETQFRYLQFSEIRGHIVSPRYQQYALYTARHLRDWYRDNQFCGRCGKEMHHSDTERCMVCHCGYHSYPRIMPAVIVGVTNGDKILITRYRTGYKHNALIAGFVEIGETIEQCVAREVREETGIRVKNIRYYKSQPWGIANDILVGYFCDVDGDDSIKMDEGELRFADWISRDDIELQPDDISLTNEMMKLFKAGEVI